MIAARLKKISRATFVRYWHHTALELWKYMLFLRL